MGLLIKTINKIKRHLNPSLKVRGILVTMTDERTNLSKKIRADIHEQYGKSLKVFDTSIPRCVKASESTGIGESIFKYDPNGEATKAYATLVKEVISDGEKKFKRHKSNIIR